jgi:hypothetical protein
MSDEGGESRQKLTDLALKLNRLEAERYPALFSSQRNHIPAELLMQLARILPGALKERAKQ